jgi:hypothetical protein
MPPVRLGSWPSAQEVGETRCVWWLRLTQPEEVTAEALSRKPGVVGAVAFSRTGDPATGDFGDATVIRKFGDVPDDLSMRRINLDVFGTRVFIEALHTKFGISDAEHAWQEILKVIPTAGSNDEDDPVLVRRVI